jgi:predicted dehydrogenase
MVRVGIVGIGFMGMIHYLAWEKIKGAKVAAICTRDPKKLAGDWRGIQGNFGPPGKKMPLKGVARYAELEQLLADDSIDLIDLCLPPNLHCDATVAALQAGKHVLVEKPVALWNSEADKMQRAAEKAGKLFMVAHVLPFVPEYDFAYKAITGGKYGKLLGGTFKRVISDPLWLKDFYDPAKVGGPVVDLHIHDAHFIRVAAGYPESVFARGRVRGNVVEYMTSEFLFADRDLVISAQTGVINQQGRPFTHAFEIHLEKATLLYDSATVGGKQVGVPLTLLSADGKATQPKLSKIDGFEGELTAALKSVQAGKASPLLSGALAADALRICHAETQSVLKGKQIPL